MRLWCKRVFAAAAVANILLIGTLLLTSRSRSRTSTSVLHVRVSKPASETEQAEYDDHANQLNQVQEMQANQAALKADFAGAVRRQLSSKMRFTLPQLWDEISCAKLLAGDAAEQARALSQSQARPVPMDYRNDEFFAAQPCASVMQRFVTESLSREEVSFPVAFSLLVFKDFYQVEKLFRAMYRPEHFYCFHVDAKADNAFYQAVSQYAGCFANVVLTTRRVDISWGQFSVLEADLLCMQRLLEMSKRWRYFINLTGQEFPLRTLRELVQILGVLNGANNMENAGPRDTVQRLDVKLSDGSTAPLQWYKGSVHVTVTRAFVEFALSDTGRQISEHLRVYGRWPVPDETFFATLNNNPKLLKVPGADKSGLQTDNVKQPFLNRYKNWLYGVFGYPCRSFNIVRQLCIWGVRDLPDMNKRFEFFVNKFYYNFQRYALQCMEERFWNNTMADYNVTGYRKTHQIATQYYSNFEFVRNHV